MMKTKSFFFKTCLWTGGLVAVGLFFLTIVGQGAIETPPTPGADQHDAQEQQVRARPARPSALDEGTAQESEQTAHIEQSENDGAKQDRAAVEDAPEVAAAGDAVAPIGPRQTEGMVFPRPDLPALAARLPAEQQAVFARIHREFPSVNLTDTLAYHRIQGVKRQEFGFDLTDATADQFRQWISDADHLHRQLVSLWAEDLGLSRAGMDEQGRGYALIGFEKGQPVYTYTMNVQAAVSTAANRLRWNQDFDPAITRTVDGTGIYVNINDHGEIFEHDEFQLPDGGGSRIMVAEARPPDEPPGDRNHMTHVAGTVAAWGYSSDLLGMAPRVWIRSLILQSSDHVTTYAMRFPGELHNSLNPRTGEMQVKSTMGNTSIGSLAHDLRYVEVSRTFDIVLRDFPYYIHFYAAGNNGSQLWGKTGFGSLSNDRILSKNTLDRKSVV